MLDPRPSAGGSKREIGGGGGRSFLYSVKGDGKEGRAAREKTRLRQGITNSRGENL